MPQDKNGRRKLTPEEIEMLRGGSYDIGAEEEDEFTGPRKPREWAKTAAAGALLARLGTGIGSGVLSAVPGVGTASGAAVAGAGEWLAQKIESGDPIDKSAVMLEGGLGAIPFAKWVSGGRKLVGALRGAGLMEAGNVMRRYNATGELLPQSPLEWAMEAGTSAIGAGGGYLAADAVNAKIAADEAKRAVTNFDNTYTGKMADGKVASVTASVPMKEVVESLPEKIGDEVKSAGKLIPGSKLGRGPLPITPVKSPNRALEIENEVAAAQSNAPRFASAEFDPTVAGDSLRLQHKIANIERSYDDAISKIDPSLLTDPKYIGIVKRLAARRDEAIQKARIDEQRTIDKPAEKLLKAEERADIQDLRNRKGSTDIGKIESTAAKAQAGAYKDVVETEKAQAVAIKAAEKAETERLAQERIDQLLADEDVQASSPIVAETTVKVPTADGSRTLKQTYRRVPPKEDGDKAGNATGGGGSSKPIEQFPKPERVPKLDPDVVATASYSNREKAFEDLGRTGKPGVVVKIGHGKYRVVFDDDADPGATALRNPAPPPDPSPAPVTELPAKAIEPDIPALGKPKRSRKPKVAPVVPETPSNVVPIDQAKTLESGSYDPSRLSELARPINETSKAAYEAILQNRLNKITGEKDLTLAKDNFRILDEDLQYAKRGGNPDEIEFVGNLRDEALDHLRKLEGPPKPPEAPPAAPGLVPVKPKPAPKGSGGAVSTDDAAAKRAAAIKEIQDTADGKKPIAAGPVVATVPVVASKSKVVPKNAQKKVADKEAAARAAREAETDAATIAEVKKWTPDELKHALASTKQERMRKILSDEIAARSAKVVPEAPKTNLVKKPEAERPASKPEGEAPSTPKAEIVMDEAWATDWKARRKALVNETSDATRVAKHKALHDEAVAKYGKDGHTKLERETIDELMAAAEPVKRAKPKTDTPEPTPKDPIQLGKNGPVQPKPVTPQLNAPGSDSMAPAGTKSAKPVERVLDGDTGKAVDSAKPFDDAVTMKGAGAHVAPKLKAEYEAKGYEVKVTENPNGTVDIVATKPVKSAKTPTAPVKDAEGAKPVAKEAEASKEIVAYASMPNDAVPSATKALESLGFTNVRVETGEYGSKIFAVPPPPKPAFTPKGLVKVDLTDAKKAADVQRKVIDALQDYIKRVEADDAAAGINRNERRPDIIRGIAANGVPPLPIPDRLILEVPNGPTFRLESPEQAQKLIERLQGAKSALWQGIADKVAKTKPPMGYTTPGTQKATIAKQADADDLMLKDVDIIEHDKIVGPKAASVVDLSKNANVIRKVALADIPKEANLGVVATVDGKTTILLSDNEAALKAAAKQHLNISKPNIQTVPTGTIWEDAIKKFAKNHKLDENKISIGTVGMDKTVTKLPDPPPTAPTGGKKGAIPVKGSTVKKEPAVAADKPKKAKAQTPEPTMEQPTPVTKDLSRQSLELQAAWDKYFDLKAAVKAGTATEEELREAGAAAGRMKSELAKAVLAAEEAGEPIPAFVKASKDGKLPGPITGKGPTSDEILSMPAEEQEKALEKIAAEFKKARKRGKLDEKGIAANELIMHSGLATAGAIAGAAAMPEDPFTGFMLGAGVGIGAPAVFRAVYKHINSDDLTPQVKAKSTEALGRYVADVAHTAFWMVPDYYRASLLSNPPNLIMNAFAGPYGAAVMAATEAALSGDGRGIKALQLLASRKFLKDYRGSWSEAKERINDATERSEGVIGKVGPLSFRKAVALPAEILTAGDISARKLMMEAGFTELEARAMTLTSEPRSIIGKGVGNFRKTKEYGKTSWIIQMALPFYRTNVNQVEQGLLRVPGLGRYLRKQWQMAPLTLKHEIAQGVVTAGAAGGGYAMGALVPEKHQRVALKFINNFGGQYGTMASLGFIAGAARQKGKDLGDQAMAASLGFIRRDMPFPTADLAIDTYKLVNDFRAGKPITLPYGTIPPLISSKEPGSIPSIANAVANNEWDGWFAPKSTEEEYSVFVPFASKVKYKGDGTKQLTKGQLALKRRKEKLKAIRDRARGERSSN